MLPEFPNQTIGSMFSSRGDAYNGSRHRPVELGCEHGQSPGRISDRYPGYMDEEFGMSEIDMSLTDAGGHLWD